MNNMYKLNIPPEPQINKKKIYKVINNDILYKLPRNNDNIYLIFQFFIHSDKYRLAELQYCLNRNIELGLFNKIILLNEKIYTNDKLGINDDQSKCITQININRRIKFNDIFYYTKDLNLNGYIVFCNSDIFFDNTILNIRKSILSKQKAFYTLCRYEFSINKQLDECEFYKYAKTGTTQDTWIYHTSQVNSNIIKNTNFYFGVPACDHKIAYELIKNRYTCYNVPLNVKTYHFHSSAIRNYTEKERLDYPWTFVIPIL